MTENMTSRHGNTGILAHITALVLMASAFIATALTCIFVPLTRQEERYLSKASIRISRGFPWIIPRGLLLPGIKTMCCYIRQHSLTMQCLPDLSHRKAGHILLRLQTNKAQGPAPICLQNIYLVSALRSKASLLKESLQASQQPMARHLGMCCQRLIRLIDRLQGKAVQVFIS